jgi:SAM-dependent methyltransferase
VTERRDHYSYSHYADPVTARRFDQARFGSPIGQLVSDGEAEAFLRFAGPVAGRTVLDVGTGTGRMAMLFAKAGASVTGIDASDEMLTVARERAAAGHLAVQFMIGDAHKLEFPDQSFDVIVSSRVLMHTPGWQTCIDEWCRVARDRVVIDFPSARSFAWGQSLWRRGKHAVGVAVKQPYRVFFDRQVSAAFARNGFQVRAKYRHFVLPVGFYKLVGSIRFAQFSEGVLRRLGITLMFASPVTMLAERCDPVS